MSAKLEALFQDVLAPVAAALGLAVTRQDWGVRCSEVRLRSGVLELELFLDVIDEASVRVRLRGEPEGRPLRSYAEVLRERLGSDFGLAEALGGWSERGFRPADAPRMFAVIAETLPRLVGQLAQEKA